MITQDDMLRADSIISMRDARIAELGAENAELREQNSGSGEVILAHEATIAELRQKVVAAEFCWMLNARCEITRAGLDGLWSAAIDVEQKADAWAKAYAAREAGE